MYESYLRSQLAYGLGRILDRPAITITRAFVFADTTSQNVLFLISDPKSHFNTYDISNTQDTTLET